MALASTANSTEVLAGLVDRVTFHNSENGFCVLRVKARGQRDLITLVGHAAMISAGEFVQASGSWTNDRTPYAMNLVGLLSSGPQSCAGPVMPFSPKSSSCSTFFQFSPFW
jgi:hypothetical protein